MIEYALLYRSTRLPLHDGRRGRETFSTYEAAEAQRLRWLDIGAVPMVVVQREYELPPWTLGTESADAGMKEGE